MRYLLIDDNHALAAAISHRLERRGHAVDHAATLAEAEHWVALAEYDMILLDFRLPDGDGRDFLARGRARLDVPVIVMAAGSQAADRVAALDQGADDFLGKPFDLAELEARCRAVLRRRHGSPRNEIALGASVFDPLAGTLRRGRDLVELRNREIRLLEVFARHPGQILSKSQLIDRLFSQDADVTENAIEVYVGRLRRRIDGMGPSIRTVRGLGYRMDPGGS